MAGDRWIKVVEVNLKDPQSIGISEAVRAGFRVAEDKMSLFTTTCDWLGGQNPWGMHNDMSFSAPTNKIRQGIRISEAAEEVQEKIVAARKEKGREHLKLDTLFPQGLWIKLAAADFQEGILPVLAQAQRHQMVQPLPPGVARCVLPILEGIEHAVEKDPLAPPEPKPEASAEAALPESSDAAPPAAG